MKTIAVLAMTLLLASCASEPAQWTEEKASAWGDSQEWLVGCNYIPSSAINQIEMWSKDSFDRPLIEKELSMASDLGFNTLRVYLSSVVYNHDPEELKGNMETFLQIADRNGIRPLFVFFDDCWNEESQYGVQPEPKTGVHNSGWVQDPSVSLRADTLTLFPNLEKYVKDVLTTFKDDERILMWDLYNEPGNQGHKVGSMPLLRNVFKWAQDVRPSQPLTSGVWENAPDIYMFQLENSDVVTYHCYSDGERQQTCIDYLKQYNRPLVCTEYMARTNNSTFQDCLPVLKENKVGAINWGFVSGKTNTIYAWSTPMPEGNEPEVWFHDIYRTDGTPFSEEEVSLIKSMTGR